MSLSIWINGIVWITDEMYTVFTDYSNFSHLSLTRKINSYYFLLFLIFFLFTSVWLWQYGTFDTVSLMTSFTIWFFSFMFQVAINANVVDFVFFFISIELSLNHAICNCYCDSECDWILLFIERIVVYAVWIELKTE